MISKITIGIDARFLLRPLRGIPMYVYMLCKYLPNECADMNFIFFINREFPYNDSAESYEPRLKEVSYPKNVKIVNMNSSGEIWWEQFLLPRMLGKYSIDVLHMPGNRICATTKTIQITTIHDVMEWKYLKVFSGYDWSNDVRTNFYFFRQNIYKWFTYKVGLKLTDHILTISNYSKTSILETFPNISSKEINYVHHGIPPGFSSNKVIKGFPNRSGVLMLGGDSIQKNAGNMIRAWHHLPNKQKLANPLTIVGFVGGSSSSITRTISELNCKEHIALKGWVDESELVELFNSHRAFIFASVEEGFGFPLLQAISAGIPVVTSKAEVLLEIGSDAVLSGDASSPQELGDCLNNLLENEKLWSSLNRKGLERAKDFSWGACTRFVGAVYKDILRQ
jgi:glycosyltransferase involved in cell wall biosynthesis